MPAPSYFNNPDYCEYVRLLAELHALIAAGRDETPEGELLRDRMDACSENFSDEKTASLNGLSADFYSLSEAADDVQPPGRHGMS